MATYEQPNFGTITWDPDTQVLLLYDADWNGTNYAHHQVLDKVDIGGGSYTLTTNGYGPYYNGPFNAAWSQYFELTVAADNSVSGTVKICGPTEATVYTTHPAAGTIDLDNWTGDVTLSGLHLGSTSDVLNENWYQPPTPPITDC